MALALNQSLLSENTERPDSEVQKNTKSIRKSVKNILDWGYNSALASSAINGIIGAVTTGVSGAISGLTYGFGGGLIIGSTAGLIQNIGRRIRNWRRK